MRCKDLSQVGRMVIVGAVTWILVCVNVANSAVPGMAVGLGSRGTEYSKYGLERVPFAFRLGTSP